MNSEKKLSSAVRNKLNPLGASKKTFPDNKQVGKDPPAAPKLLTTPKMSLNTPRATTNSTPSRLHLTPTQVRKPASSIRHPLSTKTSELRKNLNVKNVSQLEETLKIKNDVHNIKEQIMHQEENIQLLRKSLNEKDIKIKELDADKINLSSTVQQLYSEKQDLANLLEEELSYRKTIEVDSQSHMDEIRRSFEKKVDKFNEEMKAKEEINNVKQKLINELDLVVQELREKTIQLDEENRTLRNKDSEIHGKISKKYRGSYSMIQSQLSGRTAELEKRLEDIVLENDKTMHAKMKEHGEEIKELRKIISNKNNELELLKVSAQEPTNSTLDVEEIKQSNEKLKQRIKELEGDLSTAKEVITKLETERDLEEEYSLQVQVLEAQLEQTIKMNDGLSLKFEMAKHDITERDSKIADLDSTVTKLEKCLKIAEKQKEDLLANVHKNVYQGNSNVLDSSAVKLLQDQLEDCESKFNDTKESLVLERLKTKELQEKLNIVQRDFGLSKVDVRVLKRDNNNLEQQVQKINEDCKRLSDECSILQKENSIQCKKLAELDKNLADFKNVVQKSDEDEQIGQKNLDAALSNVRRLENLNKNLQQEISNLKEQVDCLTNTKQKILERDLLLQEKDAVLRENERKIESLNINLSVLRETLSTLETQLSDFETALTEKLKELETAESNRVKLTAENLTLKEQTKKLTIDLNEVKSLKVFVERRLRDTEDSIKTSENRTLEEMRTLKFTLEETRKTNEELSSKLKTLVSESEVFRKQKSELEILLRNSKIDIEKLTDEVSNATKSTIELKDVQGKLKTALQESIEKAEFYKKRYDILTSANEMLDSERVEREILLQQTLQQQTKLIEYLQEQNDQLLKKKERRFNLFAIGKDENATPKGNKEKKTPRCTNGVSTPKNLVQEHKVVRNLEEKAADLKNQLALLQQNTERCHIQSLEEFSSPTKEECILLKSNEDL